MVNLSDGTVQVALSKWKTGGYADYFELSRPAVESWSRNNDPRGFLVSLRAKGEMNEYIYYLPSIENIGGNYLTILFVKLSETKLSIYVTQKNF